MTFENMGIFFDEFLVLAIAVFLLVKGLVLRRRTGLGRAFARNNFAFSAAYFGIFLATVFEVAFFRSQLWIWGIRTAIFLTLLHAFLEIRIYYGGWRGLGRELRESFYEFRDSWCEWGGMFCYRFKKLFGRR